MSENQEAPPADEAVEAPADEAVETPAEETVETPVDEAVETPAEEAVETPEETAPADPFEEFGGRDAIVAAKKMHDLAATEDGVIQLFLEAGQAIGLGLKEMQGLFGESDASAEPDETPDPDEPLTRGEYEALVAKQAATQAEQAKAQQVEAARSVVAATMKELDLDPANPSTQTILNMGDK
jgi:hypothetical protein